MHFKFSLEGLNLKVLSEGLNLQVFHEGHELKFSLGRLQVKFHTKV